MQDERNTQFRQGGEAVEKGHDQVEVKDRGLFDSLLGKKKEEEEEKQEAALATGMEKVSVAEPEVKEEKHETGEKKEGLLSKLHRSSSSSSSDEEEEVIDEKGEVVKRRKKKKGLKEKIKEKLPGHKDQEGEHKTAAPAPAPVVTHGGHHDTAVAVEKIEGDVKTEAPPAPVEEKKGLFDKIKEKLPGGHKKPETPEDAAAASGAPAAAPPAPALVPATGEVSSPDGKEKKGILGKIMEKLPGYHKGAGEEDKAATTAPADEHKASS